FLDEIGELPAAMQAKLLRVVEYGDVQRVGSAQARRVDVRVIAATNRSLVDEVAAGRFRQDLYYRLNIVEVRLPPLRERREDIPRRPRRLHTLPPPRHWIMRRPRASASIASASNRPFRKSAETDRRRRGCLASAAARCTAASIRLVSAEYWNGRVSRQRFATPAFQSQG